jgi:stress response protein SCP2
MTSVPKGGNASLPESVTRLRVVVSWAAGPNLDVSALLLTAAGKVRSDADFVFYNQPASPEGSTRHLGKDGTQDAVGIDLPATPPDIETIALTASTDASPFSAVAGLTLQVLDDATTAEVVRFELPPAGAETAVVLGELYRRNGSWKFRAVGQGWASGLAGLARDYGISVDEEPAPVASTAASEPAAAGAPASTPPSTAPAPTAPPPTAPAPTAPAPATAAAPPIGLTKAVRLEKQLAGQPPQMLDMVKRAGISLQKRGLDTHRAKVALCLDISPSMYFLYQSGAVQQLCERVLALTVQLDDDGECDVFTFGGIGGHDEGPLDLRNYQGWIPQLIGRRGLDNGTNYAMAMQTVRAHYFPDAGGGPRNTPTSAELPVFVMFVTDGATQQPEQAINQTIWSSGEPIFWQFMAIDHSDTKPVVPKKLDPSQVIYLNAAPGMRVPIDKNMATSIAQQVRGEDFSFVQHLVTLPGRYLPNAGFFTVGDPGSVSDEQLYEQMMAAYPGWLAAAQQAHLIPA